MKGVRYNKSAQQFETTPFKQAVQMGAPYAKGLFFCTVGRVSSLQNYVSKAGLCPLFLRCIV